MRSPCLWMLPTLYPNESTRLGKIGKKIQRIGKVIREIGEENSI